MCVFFSRKIYIFYLPLKAQVTFLQKRIKKHITDSSFSYIFDVNYYICVIRCTCDTFLILWQGPFLQTDKKQLRQKSTSTFLTVVYLCEQSIQDCSVKSVIISLVALASFCSCFDFCEMKTWLLANMSSSMTSCIVQIYCICIITLIKYCANLSCLFPLMNCDFIWDDKPKTDRNQFLFLLYSHI